MTIEEAVTTDMIDMETTVAVIEEVAVILTEMTTSTIIDPQITTKEILDNLEQTHTLAAIEQIRINSINPSNITNNSTNNNLNSNTSNSITNTHHSKTTISSNTSHSNNINNTNSTSNRNSNNSNNSNS